MYSSNAPKFPERHYHDNGTSGSGVMSDLLCVSSSSGPVLQRIPAVAVSVCLLCGVGWQQVVVGVWLFLSGLPLRSRASDAYGKAGRRCWNSTDGEATRVRHWNA